MINNEIVLDVSGLDKRFGPVHAVNNVSFSVPKGTVYGILGPNGSGKTTTLGIILGVINANQGAYSWLGGMQDVAARRRIGAILETPNFYPYLSGYENLLIVSKLKRCSSDRIEEVLKQVGLWERKDSAFKTFSLGMKQRLAIASALLNNPEVLVLDEPTNGLDPSGIAEVRKLIEKIASEGITVVLASHLLDEVEKVCSDVLVLQKGKKLFEGKVAEVLSPGGSMTVAAKDSAKLELALKEIPQILSMDKDRDYFNLTIEQGFDSSTLNEILAKQGIFLNHLELRKKSLETYFLELTTEANA